MSRTILAQFAALALVLAGCSFGVGYYLGEGNVPAVAQVAGIANKERDTYSEPVGQVGIDFTPYWRVWNTLERKFIPFATTTENSIPQEERLYSSIEGLVASYKDQYTVFMRPAQSEDFKVMVKGELEGIGALIGEREGGIVVVAPLPNSPAEAAGLKSGDRVLRIDGVATEGMQVNAAVDRIRGQGGTEVVLSIGNAEGERDVAIVRGRIEIPSTAHAVVTRDVPVIAAASEPPSGAEPGTAGTGPVPPKTEKKDFYVLRLFNFSESSVTQFERELREYVKNGTDRLIIDLRGNPGGYMDAAVAIAGWFLPEGSPVVREYTGPEKRERVLRTKDQPLFTEPPRLAILVDKGSASAAEILAGALQEEGRAVLIGQTTFGKGSVQELVNITDTLSLKVTVARWFTPSGVSISERGLTPDILIDDEQLASATSTDPFVEAAITHLTQS